jgi:hypothetical protein
MLLKTILTPIKAGCLRSELMLKNLKVKPSEAVNDACHSISGNLLEIVIIS